MAMVRLTMISVTAGYISDCFKSEAMLNSQHLTKFMHVCCVEPQYCRLRWRYWIKRGYIDMTSFPAG